MTPAYALLTLGKGYLFFGSANCLLCRFKNLWHYLNFFTTFSMFPKSMSFLHVSKHSHYLFTSPYYPQKTDYFSDPLYRVIRLHLLFSNPS